MRLLLTLLIAVLLSPTIHSFSAEMPMSPTATGSTTYDLLNDDRGSENDSTASEVALGYFTELVRLGGSGFRNTERAAFLVRDDSGSPRCLLWPKGMGYRKQQFHGEIPDRTIAIVHTHPKTDPRPSSGDRQEALRLGIPFIVLSPRDIYEVSPDGDVIPVVKNRSWRLSSRPARQCGFVSQPDRSSLISKTRHR